MQEWKEYVMQEEAQDLQSIRTAQDVVIEAQRQSFQTELESKGETSTDRVEIKDIRGRDQNLERER